MRKRLWNILGPVICALVLVVAVVLFYPVSKAPNAQAEMRDAAAASSESFKNSFQKRRAFTDPNVEFVPFFGSSEWLRVDSLHPSVLAQAYDRPYVPYLLGQRGAVSLVHYMGLQQMLPEMKGKKAVFVVSPQWFIKEGARPEFIQKYLSTDQVTSFLMKDRTQVSKEDQFVAKRLLELVPDVTLKSQLETIQSGQLLSAQDKKTVAALHQFVEREAGFFGQFDFNETYTQKVVPAAKKLPKEFSYGTLRQYALEEGRENSSSNEFGFKDSFYKGKIVPVLDKMKGSQAHLSYVQSPEYNDFQLVLSQMAELDMNVLFVIPPVNAKWSDYTGLSEEMYQRSVAKIKYQLRSQGFTHIADFSKEGATPYFMQDTIHMGWTGWVAFDEVVNPFLTQEQAQPYYHLKPIFLKQEWATFDGDLSAYSEKKE